MIEITRVQPTPEVLETYAGIATEYEVTSRVDVDALRIGDLVSTPVEPPYTKSLDDEDPRDWPVLYDLEGWALLLAVDGGDTVGACAVATGLMSIYFDSEPWEALLWDIRVAPQYRGRGAGKALIDAAADWARSEECLALLIETQDTNFAACRLYRAAGGTVTEVRPGAYASHPDEALIVWRVNFS
jgi:ribosomal protein S18 acetylase RimI-like enzyme